MANASARPHLCQREGSDARLDRQWVYPVEIMLNKPSSVWSCLALLWAGALLAGCAISSDPAADPSATLSSPDATRNDRVAAVEQLASDLSEGLVDQKVGREALKGIAWRRGTSNVLRIIAIEALLEDDREDTANMLSLLLPTETDWTVIGKVCDLAVDQQWTELTPALVRSWSRVVLEPADDDRPERAALIALHPDEQVENVVYGVFSSPTEDKLFGERARIDAWGLLQRIDPDGAESRALLVGDTSPTQGNALLADLRAGATQLKIVPRSAEQLQWLRDLRKPAHRRFWDDAAAAISALDDEQLEGFALRHVAGVRWASSHEPGWLGNSREELLSMLSEQLSGRKHFQRTDGVTDSMGERRETIHAWGEKLSWGDALMILIADRAIADPTVIAAVFEQALRDQEDRSTEHGGILDSRRDGFVVTSYSPRPTQRMGDRRFVASSEMLSAGVASLFHYHFHAQAFGNREYAGPGRGDLEFADRFGRACLVFTYISAKQLDVDYYQPGGARIDLGAIRRPR